MVESVEPGPGDDVSPAVSRTQGHTGKRTGRGAMAPLWKSMLSKSSPLYRNSLFSFSLWESRVQERELMLLRKQLERGRRPLLHHIENLSKELQQKDKLIESLRAKLEQQQEQSGEDTPTRDHSVSGDAEQSEHSSFVMDEQGEDLDLCSELDAVSEFGQEEQADEPEQSHTYPSNAPSVTSSHDHRSTSSCPSMHCTPHRPPDGQIQTEPNSTPMPQSSQFLPAQMAFLPFDPHTQHPRPRSSTTGGFSLAEVHQELQRLQRQLANNFSGAQVKPLPSDFHRTDLHLPSQHAFQQSPFASLHPSPNMTYGPRRKGSYNDVSLSSSGFHSGARHTGTDLIEEHLREIRSFHRRLEESIQTNERLREQLAERLGSKIQDGGAPTNIYIQGLDSVSQLSTEVRVLKEENQALQSRLQQASRVDGVKQVEQLRDAVLLERSRLQQAELEAEKWAGQFRQVQGQMREQTNAFLQLKQDKQVIRENGNRLQHEVQILQQQLTESRRVVHALQYELQIYHRLHDSKEADVQEPPSHTYTMEETLNDRLDPDVLHLSAIKHIFHDSPRPPSVQNAGLLTPALFISAQLQASRRPEGEVRDGLFACRTGCHVVGHWDDFSPLQQQLLEGKALICKMEATLQSGMEINPQEGCLRSMLASTKTFKQILEEMGSALKMFWRAALPNAETPEHQKEQTLREEVFSLRHKLAEQETTLKDTFETLRNSNRTKDSMEQLIVSQLSRTRDVLKKARSNLEKNELRIESLGCSFSPPSPQSFSFSPRWDDKGQVSNAGFGSSPGPSIVTAPDQAQCTKFSWVTRRFGLQRPLQMCPSSAGSMLQAAAATPC